MKSIQQAILGFIWKGKKAKISFHQLKQSKEYGGLRLVDISAKHVSLVLQWAISSSKDELKTAVLNSEMLIPISHDLWRCNLHKKDLPCVFKRKSWWRGVTELWCRVNYHVPHTASQVERQVLWLNSHVRINGVPYYHYSAAKVGLMCFGDIWMDGKLMTRDEIATRWPQLTWLEAQGLINAIPDHWKTIMADCRAANAGTDPDIGLYDKLLTAPKPTKTLYMRLTANCCAFYDSLNRWNEVLSESIAHERYEKAFVNLQKVTNCTKLRDFQYRLLHKKLPSNRELYRWGIKSSDICTFCEEVDSITHLLFHCNYVKTLWCKLEEYLKFTYEHVGSLDFSVNARIVNDVHMKAGNIVNLYVLLLKQNIYRAKCEGKKQVFERFLQEVKMLHNIELYNAKLNNKVQLHIEKWSALTSKERQDSREDNLIIFINNYIDKL